MPRVGEMAAATLAESGAAQSPQGERTTVRRQAARIAGRPLRWLGLLAIALLAAEMASRLDDWLFADVALLAAPDRERDLMTPEPWGFRGKPHGVYRKWRLNAHGF